MKVKLSEILTGLEIRNSDNAVFLDIKSGEIVFLSEDGISSADDGCSIDDYDDSKDHISLPDNFDIDEYHMMQHFIGTVSDDNIAQTLSISIQGSGAFRRFKEHLYQYEIQDKWFAYRDNEYKLLAIEWCDDNNVEYIDDSRRPSS